MQEKDFIIDRIDSGKYGDYWFKVVGETKKELTCKYMEQSMIEVSEVVYNPTDGQFGIKRLFPFNFDVVITPHDEELENMLKRITDRVMNKRF